MNGGKYLKPEMCSNQVLRVQNLAKKPGSTGIKYMQAREGSGDDPTPLLYGTKAGKKERGIIKFANVKCH